MLIPLLLLMSTTTSHAAPQKTDLQAMIDTREMEARIVLKRTGMWDAFVCYFMTLRLLAAFSYDHDEAKMNASVEDMGKRCTFQQAVPEPSPSPCVEDLNLGEEKWNREHPEDPIRHCPDPIQSR